MFLQVRTLENTCWPQPVAAVLDSEHTLATGTDPIYGTALAATWQWLTERTNQSENEELDFGVAWLPDPGDRLEQLSPASTAIGAHTVATRRR